MPEQYKTLQVEHREPTSDYDYLKASGLLVKRTSNKNQVRVLAEQYDQALKFLEGRRLGEEIRRKRKTAQTYIDRRTALKDMGL